MTHNPRESGRIGGCLCFVSVSCLTFLLFVQFILPLRNAGDGNNLMSMTIWVFTAMAVIRWLVIPRVIFATLRRRIAAGTYAAGSRATAALGTTDEGKLMATLQQKSIIGCAILEGAALANAYDYMAQGTTIGLIIAILLVVDIASHFPLSTSHIEHWLEEQKRWMEQERSMKQVDR